MFYFDKKLELWRDFQLHRFDIWMISGIVSSFFSKLSLVKILILLKDDGKTGIKSGPIRLKFSGEFNGYLTSLLWKFQLLIITIFGQNCHWHLIDFKIHYGAIRDWKMNFIIDRITWKFQDLQIDIWWTNCQNLSPLALQ